MMNLNLNPSKVVFFIKHTVYLNETLRTLNMSFFHACPKYLPSPGLKATLFRYQIIRAFGFALDTLQAISTSSFSLTSILDPER